MQQAGPGYYPDPLNPRRLRWWNGLAWTDLVFLAQLAADIPSIAIIDARVRLLNNASL